MKKKILVPILILVLAITMCACGTSASNEEPSIEDRIENRIEAKAMVYMGLMYDVSATYTNISTLRLSEDNSEYEAYGKVTVTDKYGDKYSGNFSATGKIGDDGEITVDLDVDTPVKVK